MKSFITKFSLLFITIIGFYDLNACHLEDNNRLYNIENFEPTQQTVYVCMGKYSEAYHSSPDCRGLNNCGTKIYETTSDYAVNTLSRRPCCICWRVSSYNCATDKQENRYPDYISPLPADAFINAAIQKQRNYDAGNRIVQDELNQLQQVRSQLTRNCDLVYFDKLATNAVSTINNSNLDLSFQSHVNWAVNIVRSVSNNEYVTRSITSTNAYYQMVREYNSLSTTQRGAIQATNFYNYFMSWYNSENAATTINYKSYYSF